MTWPNVAIVALFVGGSLGAANWQKDNLSMVLAGAAAGFITQVQTRRESTKDKDEAPKG